MISTLYWTEQGTLWTIYLGSIYFHFCLYLYSYRHFYVYYWFFFHFILYLYVTLQFLHWWLLHFILLILNNPTDSTPSLPSFPIHFKFWFRQLHWYRNDSIERQREIDLLYCLLGFEFEEILKRVLCREFFARIQVT